MNPVGLEDASQPLAGEALNVRYDSKLPTAYGNTAWASSLHSENFPGRSLRYKVSDSALILC